MENLLNYKINQDKMIGEIEYNQNNISKDKILIINKITKDIINDLKDLNIKGLKIKEKDISLVCDLIENLKENTVIYEVPSLKEVEYLLRKRHTYQGYNRSILNAVRREIILNVKEDDIVIDATIGNGNDTLFLAKNVPKGQVIGYDIQEKALAKTKELTKDYNTVTLYLESHENMANLKLTKEVSLILFNLGYLPQGDKKITTLASSSLKAIQAGLTILKDNGLILVVIYPGHEEGKKEEEVILNWLERSNLNYEIKRNTNNKIAPFLVIIKKG